MSLAAILDQVGPTLVEHIAQSAPPSERETVRKVLGETLTAVTVAQQAKEEHDQATRNARFIASVAADLLVKRQGPQDDIAVRECCALAKLLIEESKRISR